MKFQVFETKTLKTLSTLILGEVIMMPKKCKCDEEECSGGECNSECEKCSEKGKQKEKSKIIKSDNICEFC